MLKKIPLSLSALFLLALNVSATNAGTRTVPAPLLVSSHAARAIGGDEETDRSRDGLQGPVRRVRTETSKLMSKGGKLTEGARAVLETATYDMKGAKIDTAYFLGASGSLTGKEVYKYDDRGNIVEMTLSNADGSVLSREKYEYEFDAMGNWTKMTTFVAIIENGQMSFEPSEVTYRIIAYYMEDATAKKLQTAALSSNTNAPANVSPASMVSNAPASTSNNAPTSTLNNKPAAPAVTAPVKPGAAAPSSSPQPKMTGAPTAMTNTPAANPSAANMSAANAKAAANNAAPPVKRANNAPVLPTVSAAPTSSSNLTLGMPNVAAASNNSSAPVVKATDDVPPPPVKPVVKAPVRPVSGGVLNGKALEMPKPMYPEVARRAKMTGVVSVEVVVDVSGKVIGARAVSGPELLRDAAERAARQAKFTPALLSGQPVRVAGVINYNFSL
ncbi:MAG TPA: TonB family protein [Pyrinomonadaceae bacterium]|jgi:protein TonB